jgi:hypothetical protein
MPDSSLNSAPPEPTNEWAEIDGTVFIRDDDGGWHYADNWILVPGARDVTLTEKFRPKRIVNAEQEVERVVVSGDDIVAAPELLGWCIEEGTPITEEGELIEVLVPYKLWQMHDRVPGVLISPEHHGSEAEQQVAVAEREFREAEQQLEKAANYRAETLRQHADEMTRQEARTITGLSVGRIQQLIREETDQLDPQLMNATQKEQLDLTLLSLSERQPKGMDALYVLLHEETGKMYPTDFIRGRVANLAELGLLRASGTKGIKLTPSGAEVLRRARLAGRDGTAEK